jgi:hypothetical protein
MGTLTLLLRALDGGAPLFGLLLCNLIAQLALQIPLRHVSLARPKELLIINRRFALPLVQGVFETGVVLAATEWALVCVSQVGAAR